MTIQDSLLVTLEPPRSGGQATVTPTSFKFGYRRLPISAGEKNGRLHHVSQLPQTLQKPRLDAPAGKSAMACFVRGGETHAVPRARSPQDR
jgi:hypothetical protein